MAFFFAHELYCKILSFSNPLVPQTYFEILSKTLACIAQNIFF